MTTRISQFPARRDGALHFHRCLVQMFDEHARASASGIEVSATGAHFMAAAADLKGPALDGFLGAAGWWIEVSIKAGPVSPEEFGRILRDAGIVIPERPERD